MTTAELRKRKTAQNPLKIGLVCSPERRKKLEEYITIQFWQLHIEFAYHPRPIAACLWALDREVDFTIIEYSCNPIPEQNALDALRNYKVHENFILLLDEGDEVTSGERSFLHNFCKKFGIWKLTEDFDSREESFIRAIKRVGSNRVD
jgi:hypothetical protein